MRTALFLFLLGFFGLKSGLTDEIIDLYEKESYKEIISKYGQSYASLDYEGGFHVGLAYYKLGKDKLAIEIMNHCIKVDKKDSRPLYIKGKSMNFLRQFGKAASIFEKAIALDNTNPSYYVGLGDAYMSMSQLDKALDAYQNAIKLEDCPERPYHKIPLILSAKGKNIPALEAYYDAKDNIEKGTDNYNNILYNIGLHESMNFDYFEAKMVLEELIDNEPTYYKAYPLLIQAYMGLRKYEPIDQLKQKLYDAHEKGELKFALKDKFCFDQFEWDNRYSIKAYERFESDDQQEYFKHMFEISENNASTYSINTKHIPNQSKPYILCKVEGEHLEEFPIHFDKTDTYSKIKSAVLTIIKEKS